MKMHDVVSDRKGITRFYEYRDGKAYIVTPFLRWIERNGKMVLQQKHYEFEVSLSSGLMGEPIDFAWLDVLEVQG